MHLKNYWELLTRYLSNECSEKDISEIEEKIKTDETFAKNFEEMLHILSVKEKPLQIGNEDEKWNEIKSGILNNTTNNIQESDKQHLEPKIFLNIPWSYPKILRYAAVFIVVIGLSYFLSNMFNSSILHPTQVEYRIIKVDRGKRLTITLYDGTRVTLDSGSELKVPTEFGDTRDVYLLGEGYFEVTHDSYRPFQVYANHALVQVMGTEFNIRAWYESSSVAVTVKEGKVALSFNDRSVSPMVYITDGKQSLLPKHGYPSNPVSVNVDDYTSWKHNELHFHDASLTEIIAQLERWYDYQFEVDDALLYKNHLTFHIKRTNVDNLLESISIITKTDVVKEGNMIKLVKKENN